eukprot:gene1312-4040_t
MWTDVEDPAGSPDPFSATRALPRQQADGEGPPLHLLPPEEEWPSPSHPRPPGPEDEDFRLIWGILERNAHPTVTLHVQVTGAAKSHPAKCSPQRIEFLQAMLQKGKSLSMLRRDLRHSLTVRPSDLLYASPEIERIIA